MSKDSESPDQAAEAFRAVVAERDALKAAIRDYLRAWAALEAIAGGDDA